MPVVNAALVPPTVTALSPSTGPTTGGTSVLITGTGFTGVTTVVFGAVAVAFTVASTTAIYVLAPALVASTVNVRVTAATGQSAINVGDQYTAVAVPPPPPPPPPPPSAIGTCLATKYLMVGGIEVANACRTLAYLQHVGHPLVAATRGGCCCDTTAYSTPLADQAPWYDAGMPESADVLGVYLEEMSTPTPYVRSVRPSQWGGTLSGVHWGPRELHLVGWVYTRTGAASEYAKDWLLEMLSKQSSLACALPDAVLYRANAPTLVEVPRMERTMRRVGLTDYKDNLEPDFVQCWGFKFEATLSAETPFLYGRPVTVFNGNVVNGATASECNICSTCADDPVPCTCGPVRAPTRLVDNLGFDDAYCAPLTVQRTFVQLPPTTSWQTASSIITVNCGSVPTRANRAGLRDLRLRVLPNPLNYSAALLSTNTATRQAFLCTDALASVEVSCMPRSSQLVLDGTVRDATLACTGGPVGSGYPYLSSNDGHAFRWPVFDKQPMMMVVESDWYNTPTDTTVTVQYVPRDRR